MLGYFIIQVGRKSLVLNGCRCTKVWVINSLDPETFGFPHDDKCLEGLLDKADYFALPGPGEVCLLTKGCFCCHLSLRQTPVGYPLGKPTICGYDLEGI